MQHLNKLWCSFCFIEVNKSNDDDDDDDEGASVLFGSCGIYPDVFYFSPYAKDWSCV